ncbi:MAG: hypothetical protein E6J91_11920 [Deltaproteobacteria bacterium]|nr:MAG: hypothetical protein E6J91_11920 [Deltaproteobacteria bacterium]
MNRPSLAVSLAVSLCWGALGCHKSDAPPRTKDDAAIPVTAPIAMPVLGVDQVRRFNFISEAGEQAHQKAAAAYRKKDWQAVRTQAEAALGKDPMHLGSHRLLAAALAQTGEPAAAVDHLVAAIAADYYQYAPTLDDDDLKSFMASSHGQAIAALAAKIHDEYGRRIAGALWLVGRRSPLKLPKEPGVQTATSRGELYAFDRETRRYFRLTHTDHQVVGFVRPASGNEVALVGFDRIDRPRSEAGAEPAPLLARSWIQLYDTVEWRATAPRTTLPAAREVTLGYAAGDQLLVSVAQATGRWTVGGLVVSSVDRTTGKLTKVTTAPAATRVVVSLDECRLVRVPDGVVTAWTGDPPVTASLKTESGKPVQIPESGTAAQWSIAVSPGGAHVAFATAVDPCAKDAAPSLYVADARTGTYKHLLSARSRFATRWAGADVLAYEDGDGAIRMWDATTGREAARLDSRAAGGTVDRSGLALDVLSIAAAPLCKQVPPAVEAAGSGDEPLPPEEPAGAGSAGSAAPSGPVTTPQ